MFIGPAPAQQIDFFGTASVTRLSDISEFGQQFKAFGNN